jgi:hypothetical protein
LLIYATNLPIQQNIQSVRALLRRDFGVGIDVRDREWFLQNVDHSAQTATAAERLAKAIVDPLLEDLRTAGKTIGAQTLSSAESRAACVYLALQLEDAAREKGLTKLCFEGFVRAALRRSDPDNRVSRDEVRRRVREVLPTHPAEDVDARTDAALTRLAKHAVRHYKKVDEFCLSFEERDRLGQRLITLESRTQDFTSAVGATVQAVASALSSALPAETPLVVNRVARIVERVLFRQGQDFVTMVTENRPFAEPHRDLEGAVTADLAEYPWEHGDLDAGTACALLAESALQILSVPPPEVQSHLRTLADAYVLMAFVRETTDVQSAVVKLFSSGELWLDTSMLLPIFAESLLPANISGQYTTLLRAAAEAGLQLRVTRGVVEEIERHMNRALTFAQGAYSPPWRGRIPFLFAAYVESGEAPASFPAWLDRFRGTAFPEDDLIQHLTETVSVELDSLEDSLSQAPPEERNAALEFWIGVQERRRQEAREPTDPIALRRLAEHDVENLLGVSYRRRQQRTSPLGYATWWVTFDRQAFHAPTYIAKQLGVRAIDSPVMTPDFLLNYLAIGPCRRALTRGTGSSLPLLLTDLAALELVPTELLERAASLRQELIGVPESIVRRKVRDTLHAMRLRQGVLARKGVKGMEETVRDQMRGKSPSAGGAD